MAGEPGAVGSGGPLTRGPAAVGPARAWAVEAAAATETPWAAEAAWTTETPWAAEAVGPVVPAAVWSVAGWETGRPAAAGAATEQAARTRALIVRRQLRLWRRRGVVAVRLGAEP